MTAVNARPDWHWDAACAGQPAWLFYPERGESTKEAKEICRSCRARQECLTYALDNGEKFGIWGGTTERERRRLRRTIAAARHARQLEAAT
jgi:WhiB family redox-sensing transcriptional regulator